MVKDEIKGWEMYNVNEGPHNDRSTNACVSDAFCKDKVSVGDMCERSV